LRRVPTGPRTTAGTLVDVIRCAVVVLAGLALAVRAAHADPMAAADLARKNTGGYVTGLPLFAYSTDIGFGFGARAYYYWNGARDDARFATTPYLHRIFVQLFASTKGVQFHWLDYDAPRVAGSRFRLRGQLVFGRNTNSNYFGHGNAAMRPLAYPDSTQTFDSYTDYVTAQHRASEGVAYSKYDQFDLLKPLALASIERMVSPHFRVLGGLGFGYTRIRDYTGTQVDATDATGATTTATEAPTRLREDCDAGKLVGCAGGREHLLRFAVSFDTRDFEPDPNRGVFVEVAVDAATVALGSEYDYLRLLAAARGYWSPFAGRADLVLAARGVLQMQTDGTPFFSLNALPFTEDFRTGLGGHRTLRGYRQDRFVGPTMALVNGEIRWTFTRFTLARQKLALIAVPFVDAGRAFDGARSLTARDWRVGYGAALRVSWNLATIGTIDYGRSSEDTGLYVNFGHMF
jgi:outer membrane protein assembly factor BamA